VSMKSWQCRTILETGLLQCRLCVCDGNK